MKVRAVKLSSQAGTGRSLEHNNLDLCKSSKKLPLRKKILVIHVDLCKIIEPERRELCFLSILLENVRIN